MSKEKPRMLIVGARGFLGSYLVKAVEADYDVVEGTRTAADGPDEVKIDLAEESSVRKAFQAVRPEVVVLLAAISDIDRCEESPEEARTVNLRGAEYVAEACVRSGARLLFTSTGAVFDGRKHGYSEDDAVNPVSVYGETKALAERSVLGLVPEAVVVRIALAIGFAARPGTNAVLEKLKQRLASGENMSFPVFEQRNPIDAVTASRWLLELLEKRARGIFHLGCQNSITRYDLGLKLASRMGYSGQVRAQHEPTPGRAPRGPDHYLLTEKLRTISAIPIPTCDQVIERCFDGLA